MCSYVIIDSLIHLSFCDDMLLGMLYLGKAYTNYD